MSKPKPYTWYGSWRWPDHWADSWPSPENWPDHWPTPDRWCAETANYSDEMCTVDVRIEDARLSVIESRVIPLVAKIFSQENRKKLTNKRKTRAVMARNAQLAPIYAGRDAEIMRLYEIFTTERRPSITRLILKTMKKAGYEFEARRPEQVQTQAAQEAVIRKIIQRCKERRSQATPSKYEAPR